MKLYKWNHTSRIFVLNSKKVYTTPYSHQSSLMMYVFENYGYNFYSIMAFWENATFVYWLCQNSWFWIWKKIFSITIFHEKKIAIFCGTFYFAPKALKQGVWSIFCGYKSPFGTLAVLQLYARITELVFSRFFSKISFSIWSKIYITYSGQYCRHIRTHNIREIKIFTIFDNFW